MFFFQKRDCIVNLKRTKRHFLVIIRWSTHVKRATTKMPCSKTVNSYKLNTLIFLTCIKCGNAGNTLWKWIKRVKIAWNVTVLYLNQLAANLRKMANLTYDVRSMPMKIETASMESKHRHHWGMNSWKKWSKPMNILVQQLDLQSTRCTYAIFWMR